MNAEIVKVAGTEIAAPPDNQERNLLTIIAQAASNPAVDPDKMEKLLAMHERVVAEQRKAAFISALCEIQAILPHMDKHGVILNKDKTVRSRYAKLEDIDVALRPFLTKFGFALSFDSDWRDNQYLLICKLSHRDGHSEEKKLLLPLDKSDFRTAVQNVSSTVSVGRRQLIKMHFNIMEKNEDDDGQGGSKPITENQALDLKALIEEVRADMPRFLAFMGVDNLQGILARDYKKAVTSLETKRRAGK